MAEFRKGEIAVVIPCFDLGATLEETVASVLTQTRAAAQIVVVDDGSTDAATQAALARIETGPARVLRGPHVGVARARARGVDETTTEFIVLLDADDVLQPTFLRKTAARMETDAGLEFVASNYELFGAVNAPVPRPAPDDLVAHLCEGSYAITALLRATVRPAAEGGFASRSPAWDSRAASPISAWNSACNSACWSASAAEPDGSGVVGLLICLPSQIVAGTRRTCLVDAARHADHDEHEDGHERCRNDPRGSARVGR